MASICSVVFKYTTSLVLALSLVGFVQDAEAQSFMDNWLARQKDAVASSHSFNQDDWLSRQKAKTQEEWIANQAASQVPASDSFSPDAWLNRQADSSDFANQEGEFSQGDWAPAASWEADDDLEASLLSDIEAGLGKEQRLAMEGNIATIENKMGPMFLALPKNEYGKLGHPSVRYMLHRFFVEQHGWFIDGLFAEGAALNASSPSHMLKNRVPMFVEGLFEKRLGGRGFGIHEMAVLVAVVEDSVHQEAQGQLKNTYQALGLPLDTNLDGGQVDLVLEAYMSGFVMNTNMSSISMQDLLQQRTDMALYYPTWPRAQNFLTQVRQSHIAALQTVSFVEISGIVKELVNTFGTFHGQQCQGLKQTLTGLQQKGSAGCVSLPDFYNKGLKHDTNWLFIESPEYMRHIGVLDESNPTSPRLLTANYINSPTNCLQPTGYYMVCCHNECDDILGQLERQLAAPSATAMEILAATKALPGISAAALRGRKLPPALLRRLEQVAEYHGGRVPIHGRLFAQWLHHVYPNECPYPHLSGKKNPQWMQDFEEETGKVSQMTGEEMESFVRNASRTAAPTPVRTLSADAGSCAPWQTTEELFAPLPSSLPLHALEEDPHLWNVASGVAFMAAASTFMITIMRTCKSVTRMTYQPKMLQI